jgi:hypothetical protein
LQPACGPLVPETSRAPAATCRRAAHGQNLAPKASCTVLLDTRDTDAADREGAVEVRRQGRRPRRDGAPLARQRAPRPLPLPEAAPLPLAHARARFAAGRRTAAAALGSGPPTRFPPPPRPRPRPRPRRQAAEYSVSPPDLVLTGWPAPDPRGAPAGAPGASGAAVSSAADRRAELGRRFPPGPPPPAGAHVGAGPLPAVAAAEAEAVLLRAAPPPAEWLAARRRDVEAVGLCVPGWGALFDAVGLGGGAGGRGLVPSARMRRLHPDDPVYC